MIVVNLFGSPGSGKSTGAAYIFAELKLRGINAEFVTEFAKDVVWNDAPAMLNNQLFLFGEQYQRIERLRNKVDIVVTDSPLFLSALYNHSDLLGKKFNDLVVDVFNSFDNLNFYLERNKPYNPIGRVQTEAESNELAKVLRERLASYNIEYEAYNGDKDGYNRILDKILSL